MKKGICCLLIFSMVLMLASAVAEITPGMTPDWTLEVRSLDFNHFTGVFSYIPKGQNYNQLISPKGETLVSQSEKYTSMSPYLSTSTLFKVEKDSADGVHDEGLINSSGQIIVPVEYADVEIISDRWQAGIKLVPSTADVKDYTFTNWSTDEKKYYQIDEVDFYFDGQKAGTLNRSQYGSNFCQAFGSYIAVPNREGRTVFYDSSMTASPYEASFAREYDEVYKNGKTTVYHQGTGQVAFVDTCTLNPEELERDCRYDHGVVCDIRGNVLFKTENAYDIVRDYAGDYAAVYMSGKYGLIDREGHEIIPPEYDEIGHSEEKFLEFGYISAVKDGKFGFLDAQGNITCDFVYTDDIVRNYVTFAQIKNLDGTIIILSAAAGELPEHYKEVSIPLGGTRAFVGRDQEDRFTVVDLEGRTLLPWTDAYRDVYVDRNATIIIGQKSSSEYDVYFLSSPDDSSNPEASSGIASIQVPSFEDVFVPAEPIPEITAIPLPAAVEDGWTCDNGHEGNTGNFCAQCGLPKPEPTPEPVQGETWTCENGHAGNTGKFCSECGLPKPEPTPEPVQGETWTCENGHAGNTGKFCAECGAPRPVAEDSTWTCENGHAGNTGKFCAECGAPRPGSGQGESAEPVTESTPEAPAFDNPFPKGFERFTVPFAGTITDHQLAVEQMISFAEAGSEREMSLKGSGIASETLLWKMYGNSHVNLYLLYSADSSEVCAYALSCELPVSSRLEWAAGELQPDQTNAIASFLWVESGEDNDKYNELLEKGAKEVDAETAKKMLRNPDLNASCLWFSHRLTYFREEIDSTTDRYWVIFHNTPD